MLGFTGKADQVAEPALVTLGDLDHALSVTDSVALVAADGGATATATLRGTGGCRRAPDLAAASPRAGPPTASR